MASWTIEPGHTEAAFRARHMMVTWVRGLFKDIHGRLVFDPADPLAATFEGEIDARKIWTGQPQRDEHLRSADFFDVERYPTILFRGRMAERTADTQGKAIVELTIRETTRRGASRRVVPGTVGDALLGRGPEQGYVAPRRFEGRTRIDRHQFGVSWQDRLPGAGVVVGNEIDVVLDVEAIRDDDLERTGAIEYYRDQA